MSHVILNYVMPILFAAMAICLIGMVLSWRDIVRDRARKEQIADDKVTEDYRRAVLKTPRRGKYRRSNR